MNFEYGFFDEMQKIAATMTISGLRVVAPGKMHQKMIQEEIARRSAQAAVSHPAAAATEIVGPSSPLATGAAAFKAGLSKGRTQMKEAVRKLQDKRPIYANPLVAAALGAGGLYLGSRLLRSRRDEE